MQRHLFLTGPSGIGKTTLIREVLGSSLGYAGGFITERALDEDGRLLGYDLYPAAAAADHSYYEGLRFLDYEWGGCDRDNDVFRYDAAQFLQESEYYPYAMLDEFGGFEIVIPQFRAALNDLLRLELPIIGVLKGAESVRELRDRLGLGERFPAAAALLREELEQDPNTLVVEMRERGDENVRALVQAWAKEYVTIR